MSVVAPPYNCWLKIKVLYFMYIFYVLFLKKTRSELIVNNNY